MTLSFRKFDGLRKDLPELDDPTLEYVHEMAFGQSSPRTFSAESVAARHGSIGNDGALRILVAMVHNDLAHPVDEVCPDCGRLLSSIEIVHGDGRCPDCGHKFNVARDICFRVESYGQPTDRTLEFSTLLDERRIKRLVSAWNSFGKVGYLLLDLVASENLQNVSHEEYNAFLQEFRDFFVSRVLSQSIGVWHPLGEIGDEYKIVFEKVPDAFLIVRELARELPKKNFALEFPRLREASFPFPRFKAAVAALDRPANNGRPMDAATVFQKTVNKTYDMLSSAVTGVFRIEHDFKKYKPSYYNRWPDYDVAVWLINDAIEILRSEQLISANVPDYPLVRNDSRAILALIRGERIEYVEISDPSPSDD